MITKEDIKESIEEVKKSDFMIGLTGYTPEPLTHREEEIKHIVNKTPNDMELGKILRQYINENLK